MIIFPLSASIVGALLQQDYEMLQRARPQEDGDASIHLDGLRVELTDGT